MSIKHLSLPLSQDDITKCWRYKDKVYVSLVCITYNQEQYIEQCLISMLAQVTSYQFEIIVHDDCSTDGTRDVLLKYQEKYPDIIKLVLQKENQFSKKRKITPLAVAYAQGEYIALCEGDDYWIDENKIEKQLQALLPKPDVDIAFSPSYKEINGVIKGTLSQHSKYERCFNLVDVYQGGGAFMPTASLLIKREVFDNLPDWYYTAPVGDYFLQVLASANGGALYIPSVMSVYRTEAMGSFTQKSNNKNISDSDIKKKHDHYNEYVELAGNHIGLTEATIRKTLFLNTLSKINYSIGKGRPCLSVLLFIDLIKLRFGL